MRRIERLYDRVAEEYAKVFAGEHGKKPKDREMLCRFAREVGDRKPVWDFGCGPGHTSNLLKSLGVDISGLDLSEKMLDQARRLHPEIDFRKGNILDLAFESDSIAGIVAFYATVHCTETQTERVFREIFRVLKSGGIVLLAFHIGEGTIHLEEFLGIKVDIDVMFFTCQFIRRCLEDTGFENIDIIEGEPYFGVEYQSRRAYVFATKPRVAALKRKYPDDSP